MAEITYRLPDYPSVLQTFIWQHYDLAPEFPVLRRFLAFWEKNLDGKLHSVRVARRDLAGAADLRRSAANSSGCRLRAKQQARLEAFR